MSMTVKKNVEISRNIKLVIFYVILVTIALMFMSPFLYVVYTSFRSTGDIIKHGIVSWPKVIQPINNYYVAWVNGRLGIAAVNSTIITLPSVAIAIILSSTCGYALARMRFKGSSVVFFSILISMFIPVAIQLIPVFKVYSWLGLSGTYSGIIAVHVASAVPFCTFVMRNFFMSVPKELKEAAIIDGCSYIGVFSRIFMPLSKPSIAVLVILEFTFIWNSFLWELLLMTDKKTPIMVGVMSLQGEYSIDWAVQCAGAVIASFPTLIIFLCFQRYFISGLTAGAVKG